MRTEKTVTIGFVTMKRIRNLIALFATVLYFAAVVPSFAETRVIPDGTVPPFPEELQRWPIYRDNLTPGNLNPKMKPLKWDNPLLHRRIKWITDVVRANGGNPSGYGIRATFDVSSNPLNVQIVFGDTYGSADTDIGLTFYNPSWTAVQLAGYVGASIKTWPYYPFELETVEPTTIRPVCEFWPEMSKTMYPMANPPVDIRKPCAGDTYKEGDMFPSVERPGEAITVFKKYRRYTGPSSGGGFAWVPEGPTTTGTNQYYWQNVGYGTQDRRANPFSAPVPPTSTPNASQPAPAHVGWPYSTEEVKLQASPSKPVLQWAIPDGQQRSYLQGSYQITERWNAKFQCWIRLGADKVK